MQRPPVVPPAALYTLAILSALAILFAVGWGLWVRGVEFASWISGIGGTAIAIATFLLGLLRQPASKTPPSSTPPQEPESGTTPGGNDAVGGNPPAGDILHAGRDAIKGSRISHNSALAVLGVVAVVGIVAIVLAIFVFPSPAEGTVCERPVTRTGVELEKHMYQVAYTEGLGYVARCGPGSQFAMSQTQGLYDGQHVSIVCQDTDGPLVTDLENETFPEGYPRESTSWYLLVDGRWISSLYVNTPKSEEIVPEVEIIDCDSGVLYENTQA